MAQESAQSDIQVVDARAALEKFVVENDDLLALEARIGKFKIFDALGIGRAEIRHSNFLAFILDPGESHGQGQLFLKAVLMDLLKKAPVDLRPLSPIDLDAIELRGVEVKREWQNIDVLITCKDPPFAMLIENKVDTQDRPKQLDRYADTVLRNLPGVATLRVYLTPDGDDPSEETKDTWVPYHYAAIHGVLKRVRDARLQAIGDDVLVFLDHYLMLLGTRFMNDKELDELCQRIYKNHRQALDLIWERTRTATSRIISEVDAAIRDDGQWHVFNITTYWIAFVPTTWLDVLSGLAVEEDDDPLHCEMFLNNNSLYLCVVVGSMADTQKRAAILDTLIPRTSEFGFKPRKNTKLTGSVTRVFGQEVVADFNDDDPSSDAIRTIVQKTLQGLLPKVCGIPALLKPLCNAPSSIH